MTLQLAQEVLGTSLIKTANWLQSHQICSSMCIIFLKTEICINIKDRDPEMRLAYFNKITVMNVYYEFYGWENRKEATVESKFLLNLYLKKL